MLVHKVLLIREGPVSIEHDEGPGAGANESSCYLPVGAIYLFHPCCLWELGFHLFMAEHRSLWICAPFLGFFFNSVVPGMGVSLTICLTSLLWVDTPKPSFISPQSNSVLPTNLPLHSHGSCNPSSIFISSNNSSAFSHAHAQCPRFPGC